MRVIELASEKDSKITITSKKITFLFLEKKSEVEPYKFCFALRMKRMIFYSAKCLRVQHACEVASQFWKKLFCSNACIFGKYGFSLSVDFTQGTIANLL